MQISQAYSKKTDNAGRYKTLGNLANKDLTNNSPETLVAILTQLALLNNGQNNKEGKNAFSNIKNPVVLLKIANQLALQFNQALENTLKSKEEKDVEKAKSEKAKKEKNTEKLVEDKAGKVVDNKKEKVIDSKSDKITEDKVLENNKLENNKKGLLKDKNKETDNRLFWQLRGSIFSLMEALAVQAGKLEDKETQNVIIKHLKEIVEKETLRDIRDFACESIVGRMTKHELQQYDEAVKAYKEAIRIDPNDARAYHNLGCAYDQLGQYDNATKL